MPLSSGTSKEARQENIKREIEAGKPPEQAVAIGYAKQRSNIAEKASDCDVVGVVEKIIAAIKAL